MGLRWRWRRVAYVLDEEGREVNVRWSCTVAAAITRNQPEHIPHAEEVRGSCGSWATGEIWRAQINEDVIIVKHFEEENRSCCCNGFVGEGRLVDVVKLLLIMRGWQLL